jgi:hypothetical protein
VTKSLTTCLCSFGSAFFQFRAFGYLAVTCSRDFGPLIT